MHECIKFRRQWISPRRTRQPRRPDARRGPPGARHPEGITPHAASPWKSPPDGTPPPTAPLTFSRFLAAQGEDRLVGFMRSRTTFDPIPEVFAAPLAAKFRHYLTVGGCPEPAAAWCVDRNLTAALEAQKRVLDRWTLEAALHADARDIPKIRRILASLPRQLARGGVFRWSLVEPRTNARKYGRALGWLIDAGMVRKVNRLDFTRGVGLPISLHENPSAFRIFPADVGILCALADIRYVPSLTTVTNPTTPAAPANPPGPDALPPGMLDALVRTALLRSLTPQFGRLWYWSVAKPRAEVAFVAALDGVVVPIDVSTEAEESEKSARAHRPSGIRALCALNAFRAHAAAAGLDPAAIPLRVRLSMRNLSLEDDLLSIPLWMADETRRLVELALAKAV